jgi:hypothetical protein
MKRGLRKVGWTWTRNGWKRIPRSLRRVKKVPLPSKHRTRKAQVSAAKPREKPPTFAEAREQAAEQGRAVSAPTPAPKAGKPTPRQPRKAWGGKYADLAPPAPNEP